MPTQAYHPNVITKGKRTGSKHRTKAEVDARHHAAEAFERKSAAEMKPPAWMSKDAREIWIRKIKEISGLKSPDTLLDPLDSDVFATWCCNVALFRKISSKNGSSSTVDYKLLIALTMRINEGAGKLGFTPESRARLIRKRADEDPNKKKFGNEFD